MKDTSDIISGKEITGAAEHSKREGSALSIFEPENIRYVNQVIAPTVARKFGEERDDIAQEILLRLWKSSLTLPDVESPRAFCFTTAKNLCLNNKRRANKEAKLVDILKTQNVHSTRKSAGGGTKTVYCAKAASPEDEFFKSELREKLLQILNSLSPKNRKLFLLYLSGKSPKEISELTQIPLKTVYGILKRIQKEILGKLDLQKGLEPELGAVLQDLVVSSNLGNQTNTVLHR